MIGFPLLLIPLAIYNIIVFLMPGVSFTTPVVPVHLLSGADWPISFGDMLVALGVVLMLFEFSRASRPGAKYVMDHLLSLLIVIGAAAEFLWLPSFATSTFALLVLLAVVDFLGGVTQALRHRKARRAALREHSVEPALAPETRVDEPKIAAEPKIDEPKIDWPKTEPELVRVEPASHTRPKAEIVTPEIDSPPATTPAKIESPKATNADHIPDPEPESIGWRIPPQRKD